MTDLLFLIPILPLMGAILCGILHAKGGATKGLAGYIASAAVLGSFAISLGAFFALGHGEALHQVVYQWIATGDLKVSFGLFLDNLSGFMALVVTGVGFLIHVYSIGYMEHDENKAKFFAFLNLFIFSMSLLVLGESLPLLFVGWEGVGAMSYLLIGFWYDREGGWPAVAGQKAFITNRVGDMGFLIGMLLLFNHFGTLDIAALKESSIALPAGLATGICLLLFVGATGKSAQIPLFVWLPDAMAGPTPVSALIHAATMVTAGVYMLCRMSFLFVQSPTAMMVVATIGALTALFAASIAMAQRDIKKVLAYSTVSQLGYMFLACGMGAWSAAIFHVGTHAFFKALLFLGAGSVIHGMHEEQDIMKMGGLRKHMKITYVTFLIGGLCLAGFPFTSGFFSKDEILWETVKGGGQIHFLLWGIGALTALMTAFYTFRLVGLTFFGKERFDPEKVHPHESPKFMTIPLMVLATLALLGGLMGLPELIVKDGNWIHHFLSSSVTPLKEGIEGSHGLGHESELLFLLLSSLIAIVGIAAGFVLYSKGPSFGQKVARIARPIYVLLAGKWFIDQVYQALVLTPLFLLSKLAALFDLLVVDGLVNMVGGLAFSLGRIVRRLQDGHLQTYALWMAGSTTALIAWLVFQLWS
jgi:NADH-quinone oxidoreductase subunit L